MSGAFATCLVVCDEVHQGDALLQSAGLILAIQDHNKAHVRVLRLVGVEGLRKVLLHLRRSVHTTMFAGGFVAG